MAESEVGAEESLEVADLRSNSVNHDGITPNSMTAEHEAVEVLVLGQLASGDVFDGAGVVLAQASQALSNNAVLPATSAGASEVHAGSTVSFHVGQAGIQHSLQTRAFGVVDRSVGAIDGQNQRGGGKGGPGPEDGERLELESIKGAEAHTAAQHQVLESAGVGRFIGGFLDKHQLWLTVIAILNILGISNRKSANLVLAAHSRAVIQ